MKHHTLNHCLAGLVLALAPLGAQAQYPGQLSGQLKAELKAPMQALAFDYADVRLLDSPFRRAMQTDERWLREADVNRFLHTFRVTAGIRSSAPSLGGWESLDCELRGHTTGHLLSALALAYASTGDKAYRDKGAALVAGLAECQQAMDRGGYLSAFPEHFIDRAIAGGDVVWAPWYTLHKLWAGLLDQYTLCRNEQAGDVLQQMADWAWHKLTALPAADLQRMLLAEFGGMPEVCYNLYVVTGNPRHKELADLFYHHRILDPLAQGVDSLEGIHANTQIPKVVGEARAYELTGEQRHADIARFFWQTVVARHSYVTGGNSDREVFSPAGRLSEFLGENTTETCNTYNMLKLTRHLFCWQADPVLADYYERALYNHILSSQDPVTGGVTYYHTLHPGSAKTYHYPFKDNTCCVGTGYENHVKYGESIYWRTADDRGLYVNLFIPSVLDWQEKGLLLRQETRFPDEQGTRLTVAQTPAGGVELTMLVRHPSWATEGVTVRINGKKAQTSRKPGSYIRLNRRWQAGDVVSVDLPMTLHAEAMPDNPHRAALLYGPIVLAADLGAKDAPAPQVPVLKADLHRPADWLEPVEGKPLTFRTRGAGHPADVELSPLFRNNDHRYTVYFDFNEE